MYCSKLSWARAVFFADSTYADLPSQMPSIMLEDSLSVDFIPQQYHDSDFDDTDSARTQSMTSRSLANVNNHAAPINVCDVSDDNATAERLRRPGNESDSDPDTTLNDQSSIVSMTSPTEHDDACSTEPLDFRHEHFRRSFDDDDDNGSACVVLSDAARVDDVTSRADENQDSDANGAGVLAGALGLITSMTSAGGNTGDQMQVGAMLAGALQGAQESVLQAGGGMVQNLMQQTVAGLSGRFTAASEGDQSTSPPRDRDVNAKCVSTSRETEEFVILDSDDLEDFNDST